MILLDVGKAVHSLHYNTLIFIYEEIFNAMVQMQMEDKTNMYFNIDEKLLNNLINLRKCERNHCDGKTSNSSQEYHYLQKYAIKIMEMLLKDISLQPSFITAARETNIDLHLQNERQFLKLAHAFDQINYSCWGSYH